ncbi:hypothetical protein BKA61DRAFT_582725 [Leptodontidium sp. MPI-SDFR-AT-0119]|nr:hypothetical protein BKA61DRAFT_582725 [Leptodontidium sp. MPI-SDFR-AT-0119]
MPSTSPPLRLPSNDAKPLYSQPPRSNLTTRKISRTPRYSQPENHAPYIRQVAGRSQRSLSPRVIEILDSRILSVSAPAQGLLHHMGYTLSPRIVEILTSDHCTTGFYSQVALPTALHVCRESRQAVEARYPLCFGSFLQPERVRFNFDLDILYLDISQEEDGLYRLFGVLKETELARLKYVAIDEAYLGDGLAGFHSTIAGLKNALRAMTTLKEMIMVRDITTDTSNDSRRAKDFANFHLLAWLSR